jgi:hypothetical protein
MFSAVHPTTDIAKILRHVRFVAQERTHAPQQMPSLFDHFVGELLKLQRHIEAERFGRLEIFTSSNFVGCPTGRSAGAVPLRILST